MPGRHQQFKIEIVGQGQHGCDQTADPGDRLKRCRQLDCVDCLMIDMIKELQSKGYGIRLAEMTQYFGAISREPIVDDLLSNTRLAGHP